MKKYVIFDKIKNQEFNYFIICLTYESIWTYLDDILKNIEIDNSTLLFDTLLINGKKDNRFIALKVQNSKNINLNDFFIVSPSKVSKDFINISYSFFLKNKELLNLGVLTMKERNNFIKKCEQNI